MPTPRVPQAAARRPVQTVTSASVSLEQDRHRRMRSYLIAMGVRTVSFPLAVWAFAAGWTAVGLLLTAAAVLIPSVAVMVANAVDRRRAPREGPASPVQALAAASGASAAASGSPAAASGSPSVTPGAAADTSPLIGTVVHRRETPPS